MTDLEHQDSFNFYSVPNGRMPPHLDGGAPPESEFHTSTPELSPASDTGSTVTTTGLTRSLSTSSKSKESTVHQTQQRINIATTNPSHLFWVPASQHPEIAPGEFEEFLRTNALSMQKRSSLKRRSSILSVSFTPGDAEEEENGDTEQGEQRKDALDALERGRSDNEEEQAEGGKKDRRRVRRSLSLNMASEAADQQIPDFLVFDRNSSPLDESRVLVPRADRTSLSRRGARTKFHRNSSFNSRKRVQEQDQNIRPSSFSGPVTLTDAPLQQDVPEIRETAEPGEQVHELAVAKAEQERPPPTPTLTPTPSPTPPPPPPPEQYNQIESEPPRIEPQRKSSWSWGFKKSSSKSEQQKSLLSVPEATPQPRPSRSSETPKKFGLSSLFSRKKSPSPEPVSTVTMTPPKDFQLNRINNNRLPLHIERAIYRLSHAKLANPRRPLHEQVLISNFMFWYLSIVSSSPQHQQRQHNSHSHENPRKMVKKGKRPPAPPKSNKHSPQHHPQKPSDAASYQKYMGASTGFVIPENYLRPNKNPPTSPTPPTPPVVKTNAKRNQRRPSYYDSDEDDDDAESTDSSSENESPSNTRSKDDNLPLSMYTKKK